MWTTEQRYKQMIDTVLRLERGECTELKLWRLGKRIKGHKLLKCGFEERWQRELGGKVKKRECLNKNMREGAMLGTIRKQKIYVRWEGLSDDERNRMKGRGRKRFQLTKNNKVKGRYDLIKRCADDRKWWRNRPWEQWRWQWW